MKLGSNLTRTVSRLTGVRQTRREERKATKAARKDNQLKKQIADAQAKQEKASTELDEELNADSLARKREAILQEQDGQNRNTQTLTLLDELAARVVELEGLQYLTSQTLEKAASSFERSEKAVEALNLRLLEVEQTTMSKDDG